MIPRGGHLSPGASSRGGGTWLAPVAVCPWKSEQLVNSANGILLVSELFPPTVGGSAEVFGNIYARLGDVPTTVLTDASGEARDRSQFFKQIHERKMATRHWGLLHPRGLVHHLGVAGTIRRIARGGIAAVHCGRVLPEGLSALLASTAGAPPYYCWAHGEELGYIDSSRELRRLAATVYARARAVFANSRNTATLLARRGVPSRAIHVIRLGVEHERFRPDVHGSEELRRTLAPEGQTVLLTVGRLQRRKGHDLVLEALKQFGDRARCLRYVIVGDGEERQRLEQMVRDYGLGPVVVFAGKAPAAVLPQYLRCRGSLCAPQSSRGCGLRRLRNRISGSRGFGAPCDCRTERRCAGGCARRRHRFARVGH